MPDLFSDTTYIYLTARVGAHMFTVLEWKQLLQLARDCEWRPAGTLPPPGRDDGDWDGSYYPGYGQTLSDDDALQFAHALNAALSFIPSDEKQPVTASASVSPVGVVALQRYRGPRIALLKRLLLSAEAGELRLQSTGRFTFPTEPTD